MATKPIDPNSNVLFDGGTGTGDDTSFAFRSDNAKNDFNRLDIWLKNAAPITTGSIKLQTLKPGVKIGEDVGTDWNNTQDVIVAPDEFNISYLNGWCRLKLTGIDGTIEAILRRNEN